MNTCKHGHPLVGVNLTRRGGCRVCDNAAGKRWRQSGHAWDIDPPPRCPAGHDLTQAGAVYRYPGGRWVCAACKRAAARLYMRDYRKRSRQWTPTASPSTAPAPAKT